MKRILIWLAPLALAAADLPVKQVTLYKHGVGYFERAGKLAPGEAARLDFDASEMNDVLKSLTVEEHGGGKVTGLRYDAFDSLERRLAAFPFQIAGAQPLSAILDQLKGSRVELKVGAETVTGIIVTARLTGATEKQTEREQITLLLDSGELRTLDLASASGLRFPDATLQKQFGEYLATVANARSKEKRSVYIDSTESKAREVFARYMVPTPVWKSAYRLLFGATGQPTLEGWAIVDNTSGEDWNNVSLALVSGRPISFVSQLYQPRYITRETAELADDKAARPVVHEGDFSAMDAVKEKAVGGVAGYLAAPAAAPAPLPMRAQGRLMAVNANGMAKSEALADAAPSTVVADASGQELGELFEYRIAQPVTVRKNESAMLPFLQQTIQARKLLIYSDHASQHPTNAAELTNSSGKTLDGGPITVYDGGAYGGEALMETLKNGDKRLISYAVDLGTRITEAFNSKRAVAREMHAARGVITTRMAAEETRNYTIKNVDQKAKTLILEHPLRPGYDLLSQKPAEKTPSAYRFEIALAAGATQEFPVNEERVFDQTTYVTNLTPDVLAEYVRNRTLSEAARRQLEQIAAQKRQIAEADSTINTERTRLNDLNADEQRIRQNIQSLNSVSGQQQQVQNYARQIESTEQAIAAARDRQAEAQKRKTTLEAELNRLVEALAF